MHNDMKMRLCKFPFQLEQKILPKYFMKMESVSFHYEAGVEKVKQNVTIFTFCSFLLVEKLKINSNYNIGCNIMIFANLEN